MKSFRLLVNLIPSSGRLIAGWDSPVVRQIIEHPISPQGTWCPVETFGLDRDDVTWTARDIEYSSLETAFTAYYNSREYGRFRTPLAGAFNVRNCLGTIAAAEALGIKTDAIANGLASFKSVKRRMQVRGVVNDITVIDDFAHHPTAVKETLAAVAQRYPGRRIVAIYEPRTWTARKKIFQNEYANAFGPASLIVIAGLFESERVAAHEQLSLAELLGDLAAHGKKAVTMKDADEIVSRISDDLRAGDVVVVMSNGGFGGIHEKLIDAISPLVTVSEINV